MITKKLNSMPYANAKVVINSDNSIELISYTTLVCAISPQGFVKCFGLFSQTTRKHISAFAKEYCSPLNYYDIKRAYEENYAINYETGEIMFFE